MRYYIFFIASFLFLFSCAKKDFISIAYGEKYKISPDGGSVIVKFSTSASWKATTTSDSDWITISQQNGEAGDNEITVIAAANPNLYGERWGQIHIYAGNAGSYFNVYQDAGTGFMITQKSFSIGKYGGDLKIPIKANTTDYSCTVDKNAEDWISIISTKSVNDYRINIHVAENPHGKVREGAVNVKYKEREESILITQSEGDELITTIKEFEIGSDGGEIVIPVSSNHDLNTYVISGSSWISVKDIQTKAMTDYNLILTINPNTSYNDRIGQVRITSYLNESIVTITQSQKDELIVSTTSYTIGSDGGTLTIPVRTNSVFDCEVLGEATWLSCDNIGSKALETRYVTISIEKNTAYESRIGQLKISGSGKESIVTIMQNRLDAIITENDTFEIDCNGGDIDVIIDANVQYTATITKGDDWIRLETEPTKALERSTLTLHVDTNEMYEERVAEILISSTENRTITKQIIVTQAQKDGLFIMQKEYLIGKNDNSLSIAVNHNIEFNVQISCDWISLSSSKGLTTSNVEFAILENTTGTKRKGEISFISKDNTLIQKVTVQQLAYILYNGDYTINDATDIAFLRDNGYQIIDGNLTICMGPSISDLDNLIEEITGDLVLSSWLTTLDGLYGLRIIGGNFEIRQSGIHDFEGLNNLQKIGGSLIIKDLSSCYGLGNLNSIGGDFVATGINNFQGISSQLKEVRSLICENISSFEGLENLTKILNDFELNGGTLSDFTGLNGIQEIGGNFRILSSFTPESYAQTYILYPELTSFIGFENLRRIGGEFELSSVIKSDRSNEAFPKLTSFDGFNSLKEICGSFRLSAYALASVIGYGTGLISSLSLLREINIPSLLTVGGDFIINSASFIDGHYYAYALASLYDISFDNLTTIGGDLIVTSTGSGISMPAITKGMPKLSSVNHFSVPTNCVNEEDGFLSLTVINGDYQGNGIGFPKVSQITGNYLATTSGIGTWPKLEEINGNVVIEGYQLSTFTSFPHLKSIGGNLTLRKNNFSSIPSFGELQEIKGNLNIEYNWKLLSFELPIVNRISSLYIADNGLNSINGFDSLKTESIQILRCPQLYNFSAFCNAVRNGCSWYVSECGYNPTKYQMLNGQSEP